MKKRTEDTSCIYMHIPRTLKDYYKAWCAKRGLTMTQGIINHMKDVTTQVETESRGGRKRNDSKPWDADLDDIELDDLDDLDDLDEDL
jgi:hypothetical protein